MVETVKQAFNEDCIVKTCNRDGCSVDLRGTPRPNVTVDLDGQSAPFMNHATRCDYLFVADGNPGWVVPIELSHGQKDPNKLIKQLQAGAKAAQNVVPANAAVTFRPVFAGKPKKHSRDKIRKSKIHFYGKTEVIKVIKCGAPLHNALRAEE